MLFDHIEIPTRAEYFNDPGEFVGTVKKMSHFESRGRKGFWRVVVELACGDGKLRSRVYKVGVDYEHSDREKLEVLQFLAAVNGLEGTSSDLEQIQKKYDSFDAAADDVEGKKVKAIAEANAKGTWINLTWAPAD